MFRLQGKLKKMGLGRLTSVSLTKARARAAAAREQVAEGFNPITARRAEGPTFGAFADRLLDSMEGEWRNPKHRAQWRVTLTTYAAPLRPLAIESISTDEALGVLAARRVDLVFQTVSRLEDA